MISAKLKKRQVAKLPNLRHLGLSETDYDLNALKISSNDISASKSQLNTLEFDSNNRRGEVIFAKLNIFPNLAFISLKGNSLKTIDLEAIQTGHFPRLSSISLGGNNFDPEWLIAIT